MDSRIQKSIMNAKVNVMFYVISVVLAFFSRKYFLDNLGTEFLGLSGTLGDMLNLMNITELGIGTAVGVTLYKPIFDQDKEKICDIISVFGFLYTRVGSIIALAGIVLSCFFPIMFAKADVPLYLVYLMFFSMLYASLLGYFVNYRQIILSASQQNYVIMQRYNTAVTLKVILQIITSFLPYNYFWWIALEALTITVYTFILNDTIRKYYPWLQTSYQRGKTKFKEYKELWKKTKQVFVLKLSHLVLNSSTNMLIYAFVNLTTVALYGNYNMLMSKVTSFIDGLFTGMEASVGNLIAEGNMENLMKVFYELLCVRYFMAALCSITLYFVVSPFISVWLGERYVMADKLIILLSLHFFIQQARITVDNFKNGYGLYGDVWAPVAEVVLNIGIAVLLGSRYGIIGILTGLVVSELLIKMFWKPYYLFTRGFRISILRHYCPLILKYAAACLLTIVGMHYMTHYMQTTYCVNSWISLIAYCILVGCLSFCLLFSLFFLLDKNMLVFIRHIKQYRTGK